MAHALRAEREDVDPVGGRDRGLAEEQEVQRIRRLRGLQASDLFCSIVVLLGFQYLYSCHEMITSYTYVVL